MQLIGSYSGGYISNAIIEGLTIYRRPLFDGTYGVDVGNGDEINQIYNAGAGKDPTEITGSWDVCFCLPTNSTTGELVNGATTETWSHPHSSAVLAESWLQGRETPGPYAVQFNGTTTTISGGSDTSIDDLHDGAMTVEVWMKADTVSGIYKGIISKDLGGQGWRINLTVSGYITSLVWCQTTSAQTTTASHASVNDGCWHHIAMTWDDAGDRKIRIFLDGKEQSYSTQTAGVGTIVSDASQSIAIGSVAGIYRHAGSFSWVRISNSVRYTANFAPPIQCPADDANTVLRYDMTEGTGTSLADSSANANTGTITSGTWVSTWNEEGTPVTPYSLEFNGTSTSVNCGSDASLDDLHDGAMTVEAWVRIDTKVLGTIAGKETVNTNAYGWTVRTYTTGMLQVGIACNTTDADIVGSSLISDSKYHHVAFTWDDAGDRKIRLWVDGKLDGTSNAGVGAISSDAGYSMLLGNQAGLLKFFDGAIGWVRISNSIRYTSDFVPPSRLNPPATDANTVAQYNFRDGAGTTLTDATGVNNGTITAGTWNTTKDLATDAPGERIFNWGTSFGSDAANEGIEQIKTDLTAGSSYVIRPVLHYSPRAVPIIKVLDATNGDTLITSLTAPNQQTNLVLNGGFDSDTANWVVGIGASIASVAGGVIGNCLELTSSGNYQSIWQYIQLQPYARYRITLWYKNGTGLGTIYIGTTYSGNEIVSAGLNAVAWTQYTYIGSTSSTGILSLALWNNTGGNTCYWDEITVTRVIDSQRPWVEPFTWELPTVARNGVAANCTAMKIQVLNTAAEGEVVVHQIEVQNNIIDNPSLETGAVADPWVPDGWSLDGITAGESERSATSHSGTSSLKLTALNSGNSVYYAATVVQRGYYAFGGWLYKTAGSSISLSDTAGRLTTQSTLGAGLYLNISSVPAWLHYKIVGREIDYGTLARPSIRQGANDTPSVIADDIYLIPLTPVALTVTPASLANSTETTGIRVDGLDTLTQPIPAGRLTATSGTIRFDYTPRHSAADAVKFDSVSYILKLTNGVNRDLHLYWSSANTLKIECLYFASATWNATGAIVAGTTYTVVIQWNTEAVTVAIDGIVRLTVALTPGQGFVHTPHSGVIYWGITDGVSHQSDATFAAPTP